MIVWSCKSIHDQSTIRLPVKINFDPPICYMFTEILISCSNQYQPLRLTVNYFDQYNVVYRDIDHFSI